MEDDDKLDVYKRRSARFHWVSMDDAVNSPKIVSVTNSKEGVLVQFKMFILIHGLAVAHVLVKSI